MGVILPTGGSCVAEPSACHVREVERVIASALGERPAGERHDRTAKLQGQSLVEIAPKQLAVRFSHLLRHRISIQISLTW